MNLHDYSLDVGKAFDKIFHCLVIIALEQLGVQGKYFNTTEAIYNMLTDNITLHGEKYVAIPLNQEQDMAVYCLSIVYIYFKSLSNNTAESIKGIQIEKEKSNCLYLKMI